MMSLGNRKPFTNFSCQLFVFRINFSSIYTCSAFANDIFTLQLVHLSPFTNFYHSKIFPHMVLVDWLYDTFMVPYSAKFWQGRFWRILTSNIWQKNILTDGYCLSPYTCKRCTVFKKFDWLNFDGLAGKHQKCQNSPLSKFCAIRYKITESKEMLRLINPNIAVILIAIIPCTIIIYTHVMCIWHIEIVSL